jgi:hypothetical protein
LAFAPSFAHPADRCHRPRHFSGFDTAGSIRYDYGVGTVLAALRRVRFSIALAVCSAAAGGCGGESLRHSEAHASGASGGPGAGTGGAAGMAMGGACDKEPSTAGAPPSEPGCYAAEDGANWTRVPCNCELLLENTSRKDAEATITLSLPSTTPTPISSKFAELDFQDPDYEYFDIWTRQVGSATTILVSWAVGVTTVGLGVPSITLDPVPLRACESRPGRARYGGPTMTSFEMDAVVAGPEVGARIEGTCRTFAHPTPAP